MPSRIYTDDQYREILRRYDQYVTYWGLGNNTQSLLDFLRVEPFSGVLNTDEQRDALAAGVISYLEHMPKAKRTRKKTLFCVVRPGEEFQIKGYHSLKSASRHEPKGTSINYATPGDINRAKLMKKTVPSGVIYSKLGDVAPEVITRSTSRRRRGTPTQVARRRIRTPVLSPLTPVDPEPADIHRWVVDSLTEMDPLESLWNTEVAYASPAPVASNPPEAWELLHSDDTYDVWRDRRTGLQFSTNRGEYVTDQR